MPLFPFFSPVAVDTTEAFYLGTSCLSWMKAGERRRMILAFKSLKWHSDSFFKKKIKKMFGCSQLYLIVLVTVSIGTFIAFSCLSVFLFYFNHVYLVYTEHKPVTTEHGLHWIQWESFPQGGAIELWRCHTIWCMQNLLNVMGWDWSAKDRSILTF